MDEPVNLGEERAAERKVGIGGERVYGCCCCGDDGEDVERGIWAQLRFRWEYIVLWRRGEREFRRGWP